MKKILLGLFILLFSNCTGTENYHGVSYTSSGEVVTLPLVAFEDNTSKTSSGVFVVCFGSYETHEVFKYRVLVEFPDKTMKVIEFTSKRLFIKYGDECTITGPMNVFKYNNWYDEVILEIPEGSVKYENVLDGK